MLNVLQGEVVRFDIFGCFVSLPRITISRLEAIEVPLLPLARVKDGTSAFTKGDNGTASGCVETRHQSAVLIFSV